MKILVVDDEDCILDILVEVLHAFEYELVTLASSAPTALEAISTADHPFDCILLDVMMPEIDGIQLCRNIREIDGYRSTPIIMLTALADKPHIDRAFQAGATDYVMKPFELPQLRKRLVAAEKLAEGNRLARETAAATKSNRARLAGAQSFAVTDPILVDGVEGMVDRRALDNYLRVLSRPALSSTCSIALRILDVGEIFARCSGMLFRDLLSDVAESAFTAMGGSARVMAYVGNGTFAAVISGRADIDRGETELMINTSIAKLGLVDDENKPLRVQVVVGEPRQNALLGLGRSAMREMHQCVEKISWASRRLGPVLSQSTLWPAALDSANPGLRTHSQNMTVAPRALAKRKTVRDYVKGTRLEAE